MQNADTMMTKKPKFVLFYYQQWQEYYDDIKQINDCTVLFKKEIPLSIEEVTDELKQFSQKDPKMIVMDDLLSQINPIMTELFTVVSHHYNCSMV